MTTRLEAFAFALLLLIAIQGPDYSDVLLVAAVQCLVWLAAVWFVATRLLGWFQRFSAVPNAVEQHADTRPAHEEV